MQGDHLATSQVYSFTVHRLVALDQISGIFQGPDSLLLELRSSSAESRGYVYLAADGEAHLQVSAGKGDWHANENFLGLQPDSGAAGRDTFSLGDVQVQVGGADFNLQFSYQGNPILTGMQPPLLILGAGGRLETMRFAFDSPADEAFYGFGERFNALDQRGRRVATRVYEQYKNQGERTYLPAPLMISSRGYGLLVQSSRLTEFDLACTVAGQWSLDAETGAQNEIALDLLLGDRSRLLEIVARMTSLTGRAVLPPQWAFGLWMSSNEWNTQARVEEIVRANEEHKIPTSVIVLEAWSDDLTFYIWNGARYEPKTGAERFHYADFDFASDGMWPDPQGMLAELHKKGLHLLLWQIPALPANTDNHLQLANDTEYALENDFCIRKTDGSPYRIIPFWFHDGLMPDFTHPQAAEWWMEKRAYLLEEMGIDGFKTDGGEHIWGRDLVCADGRMSDEIWNEYPNLYVGTYFEYSRRYKPDAITFSRAGYTGAQAFPCHWAGDENSTWEAMRHSILAGLNAGISGIPFWGWDIAGFSGEIPTAELYLRAAAMAAFCPIMQYHSEYNYHRLPCNDRTPWNIAERTESPEVLTIFRYFANLRMNMLPYIIHAARQSASEGLPMMRALCLAYPQAEKTAAYPYQYLFGDSLLVAPVVEPGQASVEAFLPPGSWHSLWDGQIYAGGAVYSLPAALEHIPVFARAGSLLPLNLDGSYELGSAVGNQCDAYEQLCFKFYPGAAGEHNWVDENRQDNIGFSWEAVAPDRYFISVKGLTRPVSILLPQGFGFEPAASETACGEQVLELNETGATDIKMQIVKTA